MINREKVIKGLQIERECVSRDCDRDCGKCDLVQEREWLLSVYDDALVLLKEQEPKKVEWRIGRAHCPSCGELFPRKKETQHIRFCNFCGQEVEWDEKL